VNIRTIPTVTVGDYYKGMDLNYEKLESANVELLIDKGKYFGFLVDDVDVVQTDIEEFDKWTTEVSNRMKISIDTGILGDIYADAHASNSGLTAGAKSGDINLGVTGTPFSVTKANVIDKIVDMGVVLDEQDVPEEGRYIVAPAWFTGMIKTSDLKDASLAGDNTSILRTGRIGRIDRFTIYQSNNLTSVTDGADTCWNVIFGQMHALTFASQLIKTESLRAQNTFGDIARGLQVYGYEVIKTEALGDFYVKKG
jgi:hypothetical protein